jgi:hypothetical protein
MVEQVVVSLCCVAMGLKPIATDKMGIASKTSLASILILIAEWIFSMQRQNTYQ